MPAEMATWRPVELSLTIEGPWPGGGMADPPPPPLLPPLLLPRGKIMDMGTV